MYKVKDNLVFVFGIIIICIVFLLGKSCGSNKKILEPTTISTITRYRDTIFPVDTFYSYTIIPSKPVYIHDTIKEYLDSTQCNRFYVYNDTIKDSKYDIISKQIIQGKLRHLDIKVKLKIPLMIYDSVVVKKDSLIFKPSKYQLHIGLIASPKMLSPTIDFSIERSTYMIGYDPFNKLPIIGYKYRIWKSKK